MVLSALIIYALYSRYGYLLQSARNWPAKSELSNLAPLELTPSSAPDVIPISSDPALSYLVLPPGFTINYFASDVPGARSIAVGEGNTVYVGTRSQGVVYALEDTNQDGAADTRYVIASGLNNPNGVVYHNGDLYVAEIHRIIVFRSIGSKLHTPPAYQVVFDELPADRHHGWRYMALGPDNKLYLGIGAPCNICEVKDPYASIARLNLDGTGFEIIARGIRNTVGFAWNPLDNSLWFTDNGRDQLGDDLPPDELNRVGDSNHFGYPYCHGDGILDPQFGSGQNCLEYAKPRALLGPHVAALGLHFYQGEMFPSLYQTKVLIAEHGSWNRSIPIGYRITSVDIQGGTADNYQEFISGWLDESGDALGRPVDLAELPNGSLLISDDFAGAIYRVTYPQ